eukprot:COSAG06_NODE_32760_length_500_cov_3.266833_1_plen_43_part_10
MVIAVDDEGSRAVVAAAVMPERSEEPALVGAALQSNAGRKPAT